MLRLARRLVMIGWAASLGGPSVEARPIDEPKPSAPIPIFLNAPADRDAFWKLLGRPDMVVLDGEIYRKLRQAAEAAKPEVLAPSGVVESVEVVGEVSGDWTRLKVGFRVAIEEAGPTWVAIHLDGLTLAEVREGGIDLPARLAEGKGWQVELKGAGGHRAEVVAMAPVKSSGEGRRVEVTIPPAASTKVELIVPKPVLDATAGPNEPLAITPVEGAASTRLAARLSPRSRLEVAWRERPDPSVKLPTVLSAQGDLAIEVDRGSVRTRGTWLVDAVRGSANQLILRLDPAEEVVDLEVDGRSSTFESKVEAGLNALTIPLAEPVRPGSTRTLVLNTTRPIATGGPVRLALRGYAFDQAKEQTGLIGISRVGPLFLNPSAGRGLRRIDPRTELSENLRSRGEKTLAFEFGEQPFDLKIGVEPAPPRLRLDSRTTITVEPRSARIQARLECRTSQGRVYDVKVLLPKGLEFESAEPPDVVEGTQEFPVDPKGEPGADLDGPRVLSIALKPQARDATAFDLVLKGWCSLDPSKPVAIPLFQPVADASTGARLAVVTDRNVLVELPTAVDPAASGPFRADWGLPPGDWAWPGRTPGPEMGLLWLRAEAHPPALPLKMTVRARSIRHESTVTSTIDRRGAEVVEEINGEVAFGSVSRLDVATPRDFPARWEVEGATREPLGEDLDGTRRYRLRLTRESTDAFRVRVRYRLPIAEPFDPDHPARLLLAPLRVLEGTCSAQRVQLAADSGIEIKAEGKGWTVQPSGDSTGPGDLGPPIRIALAKSEEKAEAVRVIVRPGPQLPLPGVVVSRLWLRTVQRPENDLATSAFYWVEARDHSMIVGLPTGSRWVRARVGATELGEGNVDVIAPDEYRLRFPAATPAGSILVAIEWVVPGSSTRDGWPGPRLLGGGVVQQTLWEVQVLGTRAGVGTPSGWIDENEWFWDGLLWRRRPWKSRADLASWLNGGSTKYPLVEFFEPGESVGRHSYLFSRVGPPTTLPFAVFSRLSLFLLCSGPVLLAGLLVLARRPSPRWLVAALLAAAFAVAALVEPNVLLLVLQSAELGVVLLVLALLMNRLIDRRSKGSRPPDRGILVGPPSVVSAPDPHGLARSDESTAIRVRVPAPSALSTADHIVLARPSNPPIPTDPGP